MRDRRFSHQREQIYLAIRESRAHPTAEMVYEQLKPQMPKLSLGTVYRNLRQMAREGRLLELDGPVARFDAVTAPHTHFRCDCCGAVLDLDMPYDAGLDARAGATAVRSAATAFASMGFAPLAPGNKHITI